ncbi:potassium-transporting ATPase subunit F [Streptomyces lavendulae]
MLGYLILALVYPERF